MEQNDEKYISIEYEVWKNKYLPLEQRNIELERELEREKNKKLGWLKVRTNSRYGDNYRQQYLSLDFSIEDAPLLKIEKRRDFVEYIREFLNKEFENIEHHGYIKVIFVDSAEFREKVEKVTEIQRTIEKTYAKNEVLINKIPWIVRKIFKIK